MQLKEMDARFDGLVLRPNRAGASNKEIVVESRRLHVLTSDQGFERNRDSATVNRIGLHAQRSAVPEAADIPSDSTDDLR